MSNKPNTQAGFTLVEISLAMAIFTFMLLVVSMAYINIARLYNASTAARTVQQNNRFAMEQISRVARSAGSATVVTDTGSIKKGLCLKSSSGEQLFDSRIVFKTFDRDHFTAKGFATAKITKRFAVYRG